MNRAARTRAARGKDPGGGPRLRVVLVGPNEGLDVPPGASNNRAMDPVVIALAQLVRDRWEREQRDRANRRTTLRVVQVETK